MFLFFDACVYVCVCARACLCVRTCFLCPCVWWFSFGFVCFFLLMRVFVSKYERVFSVPQCNCLSVCLCLCVSLFLYVCVCASFLFKLAFAFV